MILGDVWVQAKRWFLGLAVVCCHGSKVSVFLNGLAEEWDDDVPFITMDEKVLVKLAKDDASGNARIVNGMWWDEL
eukprot:985150-Ditylum_brightwellii.AAC.1